MSKRGTLLRIWFVSSNLLAFGCSALVNPDRNLVAVDSGTDAPRVCESSCDDNIACTMDLCADGNCTHSAMDSACAANERCNAGVGCVPLRCATNTQCDDRNVCNGQEICGGDAADPVTGCSSGAPMRCDDNIDCTEDLCDPQLGCEARANNTRCDDEIACTVDVCREERGCEHTPNDSVCASGTCFQGATCNVTMGCVGGRAVECNDGTQCTLDRCVEGMGCVYSAIDADGDGYPVQTAQGAMCVMGTDCDDSNRDIHPGATERCDNVDQNCNGTRDEGACTGELGDSCANPEQVMLNPASVGLAGAAFVSWHNKLDNYQTPCEEGLSTRLDHVVRFELPAGYWNVTLEADAADGSDPLIAITRTCERWLEGNYGCNDNRRPGVVASRLWLHAAGEMDRPSTFFALVENTPNQESGLINFRITAVPSTVAVCGMATAFDIRGGGTVVGYRGVDNIRGSCQTGTGREAVFQIGAPPNGMSHFLDVMSSTFRPAIYTMNVRCGEAGACAVADDSLHAHIAPNRGVYVVVDGMPETVEPYTLLSQPTWAGP